MQRIEMNVQTGVRTVLYLTPEEIAQAQDNTAAEAVAKRPPAPTLEDVIAVLPAASKAALDARMVEKLAKS